MPGYLKAERGFVMEDRQGWISLHRKITNWEWYTDSQVLHLFIHLLLKANHRDNNWQGITIKRGQLITGRKQLSAETGLSEQTVRTCLKKLEKSQNLTSKSTNRFSLITILNYDSYQSAQLDYQPTDQPTTNQQLTSNQPATNQPLTTNNNVNKENNVNNVNKDLPKKNFSAGKDFDFVDKVVNAFADAHGDYTIINRGKERAAAGKLLKLYKQKYPDADSEKTIEGLRTYFKLCVNIEDNWLRQNMTLPLIVSKFNEINAVLNGKSKKSATDAGLDQLWNEIRGRMDGIS